MGDPVMTTMKSLHHCVLLTSALIARVQTAGHEDGEFQPGCKPCKQVEGEGPLAGQYYLQSDHDKRCKDHCSYAKDDDLYCFVPGQEKTTPEMKPVTFMPAGTELPPATDVKCGLRRSGGECIKDGRIVNGQESGCNEWPWQVGVVAREGDAVSTSPFCGGTLINQNHVITAAHCMPGATTASIAIMIGDHDKTVNEPAQVAYGVSAIYNHPDYNSETQANDITVLRLSADVDTTKFSPACFPSFETVQ